jgi:hypothetical protein
MAKPKNSFNDGRQVTFSFASAPAVVIPQADGSVIVRPGRQVLREWLSSRALGQEFGVSESTVNRWRQEGLIGEEFYRFAGRRKIEYRADVVDLLKVQFAGDHGE